MRIHIENLSKFSQILLAMVLALMAGLSADAQCIVQQADKLLAADGASGDQFGRSVAIDGNTAIIGSVWDDDSGDNSGSAYLFDTDTGQPTFKLLPDDGAEGDGFGHAVAISGTTAIVGAPFYGGDRGAVYLFDTTTGEQITKLLAADGATGDQFGRSVAIDGNTAIVGAPYDDENNVNNCGSAYFYELNTGIWTKLLPADGAEWDLFGFSVGISGTTAIVGVPHDDDNGDNSGSAYFYELNTGIWTKLLPADGAEGDWFGWSVAISGTTAIVGARRDEDNGFRSGSAYLFDTDTGQSTKLLPDDGAAGDYFGWSVGISQTTAIVGASREDDNGDRAGAAYAFDTSTGFQLARYSASENAPGDEFGYSVGISGTTAIVGAPYDDDYGQDSGSACVFIEPSARITVTANSQPRLITTEAGGQVSFDVVLNAPPTVPVMVDISSSDTSEGTIIRATDNLLTLTFTPTDWDPQPVTVTGVDDRDPDGDVFYTIITAAATSDDSYYDGQDACDIAVVNQDNEQVTYSSADTPVSIPDKGTATSWIEVTSDFLVSDVNVTLNISHQRNEDLDVYLVAPDGTTVELFTDEGGTGQDFFGITLDDEAFEAIAVFNGTPGSYRPEGNLGDFDSLSSFGLWTLQVTDDRRRKTGVILDWSLEFRGQANEPTPGITVSPSSGLVTTEDGGWDEFTIVLDTQPTADVTIGIASDDPTEGTVDKSSLKFTPANWHVTQKVTVTGVDDEPVNETGDDQFTIEIAAAFSTDSKYNGLDAEDVSVTNLDNDGGTGGSSETYFSNDTPVNIPDYPRDGVASNILAGDHTITNLTVNVNITHPRPLDLEVYLIGPDDGPPMLIQPFNFSGDNNVADFNGTNSLGLWTLEVYDTVKKKKGTLNSWTLTVDY